VPPSAPRPSRLGLDRPQFAWWTFAVVCAADVVLYLAGPDVFVRGEIVATLHVAVVSVCAFLLFGYDKFRAGGAGRRVAESNLLGLAWLGGAPGALAAMSLFRHKTQKPVFKFGVPAALFAHVVALGWFWLNGR
jgi:uncharacterized membrane protein YsdA (DUF1294 family)